MTIKPSTDKTKRKRLKPIEARTFKQICSLPRDNLDYKNFWFMVDEGQVTLTAQKIGEAPTSQISIPRAVFDRMARWYLTGKASK